MCTLVLAWQVFDAPVVAGANRDERLDRDATPPAVRDWEPRAVAPLDAEAGGTWIGYNEHGVVVAVTNRWVDVGAAGPGDGESRESGEPGKPDEPDDRFDSTPERSRGLLVRDALRCESAEDAARHVERAVRRHRYDGFNLVVADAAAAVYLEWDGRLRVRTLQPGIHVVVNVGADGAFDIPSERREAGERQAEGARRALDDLQPEPGEDGDAWLDRVATVLSDHEYGFCVHGDGFGTRSSSLLVVGPEERSYRYADGPPCETPFRRVEGRV